jgi:nucleoside 2-deoxyribosyltransferase
MGLPRCYVASPLGFTEGGRAYLHDTYLPALARVVEPVDPWALTHPAEVERAAAEGRERELALEIGRRNAQAIRSCELVAAYLEGQEPDAGTVAEVGSRAAVLRPAHRSAPVGRGRGDDQPPGRGVHRARRRPDLHVARRPRGRVRAA